MNRFFDSVSFRRQIFYGLLLVAMIPLIFSSFLITSMYKLAINNRMEAEGNRQSQQLVLRLEEYIEASIRVCNALERDDIAANALIRRTYSEYQKLLYQVLYEESNSFIVTPYFNIYDAGGELYYSTNADYAQMKLPLYWGLLRESHEDSSSDYTISTSEPFAVSGTVLQSAYKVRNSKGVLLGYIVMSLPVESLEHIFLEAFTSGDTVLVTDDNYNLIYSSGEDYGQEAVDALVGGKPPANFRYTWAREDRSGFYVIIQKEADTYLETIALVRKITIPLSIISLLLCIFIAMKLTKELWNPINQLNEAMNRVRKGNLEVKLTTTKTNELGNVVNNFNAMTEDLRTHMSTTLERQRELNSLNLKLLQSQLNPHFLYNTLDSIKWEAKINHLQDLAEMIDNLGTILRKSIISDEFIPLRKEMEILDSYLQIQRIRSGHSFTYEIELPEVLKDCLVPKLILQPIVENAVIHGIENVAEGCITIYAEILNKDLCISITDNGKGMDSTLLRSISQGNIQQREGHFGLFNVNQILKLYYGKNYGISATMEEEIGTTISVLLPVKERIDNE